MAGKDDAVPDTLRTIRDEVRDRDVPPRAPESLLPPPLQPSAPSHLPQPVAPPFPIIPPPPDGSAVNASWDLGAAPLPPGWKGRLGRILGRWLHPLIQHQTGFNAHQVQFDNQIREYLDARLDLTHRHYDGVLAVHGQHMRDINQRHEELQGELVRHVHDIVRRIDLVLAEGERNRIALEAALRDVRARLSAIESGMPSTRKTTDP